VAPQLDMRSHVPGSTSVPPEKLAVDIVLSEDGRSATAEGRGGDK
jgi:hypothetical protein